MSKYTDDLHSLSHSKRSCKYHVVFAPKYRRKAFYDARRMEIGSILRSLCGQYNRSRSMRRSCAYVNRNTTKVFSIWIYGYLKGKSSQMIFER